MELTSPGSSASARQSGRWDLNPGPLAPKASALAGLRHAPKLHEYNAKDEYPSSNSHYGQHSAPRLASRMFQFKREPPHSNSDTLTRHPDPNGDLHPHPGASDANGHTPSLSYRTWSR